MTGLAVMLDEARLGELVRDVPFVSKLIVLERVGSTNDVARRMAAAGAEAGTVVLAEEQRRGRGRRGREWHSPPGLGLYLSVLLRPCHGVAEVNRWTLASALAACEACRELTSAPVTIRWPNDLLVGRRKLGGILAELRSVGDEVRDVVVGVGLNVLHGPADFPVELVETATSLRLEDGASTVDRETLAAALLRALARANRDLGRGEWISLARRWSALAPGSEGQRVTVAPQGRERQFEGTTEGLHDSGALRVRRDDGRIVLVRSVESVRPASGEE